MSDDEKTPEQVSNEVARSLLARTLLVTTLQTIEELGFSVEVLDHDERGLGLETWWREIDPFDDFEEGRETYLRLVDHGRPE